MTAAAATPDAAAPPAPKGGLMKKLVFAAPVALAAVGAGLWFSGIGPRLLGHHAAHSAAAVVAAEKPAAPPAFADLPEIVANLNASPRRPSFIKLKSKVELVKPEDAAALATAMPRILDLFQTYLREMRPEELRGAAGTYRLREELIARANIAMAPAGITDLLFTEMLVQ